MNNSQIVEKNIRSIIQNAKTMDLAFISILENIDFSVLNQALRHHSETVFAYRINSPMGVGRDYRGPELFQGRATRLYSCLAPFSDSEIGIVRLLELWMLEDGTVAAVANMQIVLGCSAVISEYRTVKTCDLAEICRDYPIDKTKFASSLQKLCHIYTSANLPCYEL